MLRHFVGTDGAAHVYRMSNARTAVAQTEKVALEWSISYNRAPDMGCIYVFYSLIFAEY